jgi:hypothetical protein
VWRRQYDFCLFVVALGMKIWMQSAREQSEMSYGAQDGVWKSYFISLIAFSFRFFFFICHVVSLEICFIGFLFGLVAGRKRKERENEAEKNC